MFAIYFMLFYFIINLVFNLFNLVLLISLYNKIMGSDEFTPSRGAPRQYSWYVEPMEEAEMNPTACKQSQCIAGNDWNDILCNHRWLSTISTKINQEYTCRQL